MKISIQKDDLILTLVAGLCSAMLNGGSASISEGCSYKTNFNSISSGNNGGRASQAFRSGATERGEKGLVEKSEIYIEDLTIITLSRSLGKLEMTTTESNVALKIAQLL